MRLALLAAAAVFFLTGCGQSTSASSSSSSTVPVVAAENFYGDIAGQLGGAHVTVTSILSNPNADPHEYESSPHDAVLISSARLVIMNGAGYDSWMQHLLNAAPSSGRQVIVAASLNGLATGDNPHLWYDVAAMKKTAHAITAALTQINPAARAYFAGRATHFATSLLPLERRIAAVRRRFAGTPVAETEPVFAYMIRALGLRVSEGSFQRAIEEGNDPPPGAVAAFETALHRHTVKALVYNKQAVTPTTETVASIARGEGIPVIGVTETEPAGASYQSWLLDEVNAIAGGLKR